MADQQTTHDNAIGWTILGLVGLALFFLFWYFFADEVKSMFRWMRWTEMWLVSWFVPDDYTINWRGTPVLFSEWLEGVPHIRPQDLDGETLNVISTLAMAPLRIGMVIILALMGLWAMTAGPGTQFRRKMTLDGIIEAQSRTFAVISPFIKFNPAKQPSRPPGSPVPAELPLFSEALGPEEWLAYHQIPIADSQIDETALYVAFAQQLGPRWQGMMKLRPEEQILLACFCLKASRKRRDADDMVGRLARCWTGDKGLQLSRDKALHKDALKVLRTKNLAQGTLAKCNQHAFVTTALVRALAHARDEGGVMAPAQFVWMRGHNRAIWYPLNNLGRQSFHMEAIGAMAHYKAERMTGRPIPKPQVQNAVKSIKEYMSSGRSRPIPQLDYSQSGKRGIKKPA